MHQQLLPRQALLALQVRYRRTYRSKAPPTRLCWAANAHKFHKSSMHLEKASQLRSSVTPVRIAHATEMTYRGDL
jgi:hypothetical protein